MEVLVMNKLDYLPIWDQIVTAHSAKSAGAREPEILEKLERDAPGNLAYASRAFRAHELIWILQSGLTITVDPPDHVIGPL
ncbi:hypothetical protein RHS01_03662 [Rhizoctonia solani]|uniref:Uncharacterized protein n=1 Tax=Rhizoctonia solani TaxID=456999 RepID=A0A8H7IFZ6_9AGAM|nr:hypothetical protein RHS01_03662 [Rhizoctonia solani]